LEDIEVPKISITDSEMSPKNQGNSGQRDIILNNLNIDLDSGPNKKESNQFLELNERKQKLDQTLPKSNFAQKPFTLNKIDLGSKFNLLSTINFDINNVKELKDEEKTILDTPGKCQKCV
jgi:hypothetical protein